MTPRYNKLAFIDADNIPLMDTGDLMALARDSTHFFIAGNDSGFNVNNWVDSLSQYSISRRRITSKVVGCLPDAADNALVDFLDDQLSRSCFKRKRMEVILATEDRKLIDRFKTVAGNHVSVLAGRPRHLAARTTSSN